MILHLLMLLLQSPPESGVQDADRILRDLASDTYEAREAATDELFAMGVDRAAPILARALASRDFEVLARALHVKRFYERPVILAPINPNDPFGVTSVTLIVVRHGGGADAVIRRELREFAPSRKPGE